VEKEYRILVINPGSTSTKVAIYENEREIFLQSISHSSQELSRFRHISDQHDFRLQVIQEMLQKKQISLKILDAVVGRGGLVRPIEGGTYRVTPGMVKDLESAEWGEHASNLGGIIAFAIGEEIGVPAYIVDPVVVDEMDPIARISGLPDFERRSIFHALNQKAVARKAADVIGKTYETIHLIVAHLGGGISVGCHSKGRVIDVNNALNGDGPFSPERAGGVPAAQLIELCFSGNFTEAELKKRLVGQGGMVAYLCTKDIRRVKERIQAGDDRALLYYQAMAYQVAKEIGLFATVLKGEIDGIVLTGGLAFDDAFIQWIRERVEWIAPLFVFPGEEEMTALALGALRVMRGEEKARTY
jgi:butyrate kinase